MNSISNKQKTSIQIASKVAGVTFLFNLLVPTFSYVFILSKLINEDNPLITAENVIHNDVLFRFGIFSEIILSIGLTILGYSLYTMVRHVNRHISTMAFVIKIIEATIVVIIALVSFFALQMLMNTNDFLPNTEKESRIMAGFIINQHSTLNSIPMIFLGIEMVMFTFLLCRSHLIPRLISRFGMFSFLLIIIFGVLLLTSTGDDHMLLTLPSFLFELICGIWLLTKGIAIKI